MSTGGLDEHNLQLHSSTKKRRMEKKVTHGTQYENAMKPIQMLN